jgi:hypothetical protein
LKLFKVQALSVLPSGRKFHGKPRSLFAVIKIPDEQGDFVWTDRIPIKSDEAAKALAEKMATSKGQPVRVIVDHFFPNSSRKRFQFTTGVET